MLVMRPKNSDDSEDQSAPLGERNAALQTDTRGRHSSTEFSAGLCKQLNQVRSPEAFACCSLECAARISLRAPAASGRACLDACKEVDGTGPLLPLIT